MLRIIILFEIYSLGNFWTVAIFWLITVDPTTNSDLFLSCYKVHHPSFPTKQCVIMSIFLITKLQNLKGKPQNDNHCAYKPEGLPRKCQIHHSDSLISTLPSLSLSPLYYISFSLIFFFHFVFVFSQYLVLFPFKILSPLLHFLFFPLLCFYFFIIHSLSLNKRKKKKPIFSSLHFIFMAVQ